MNAGGPARRSRTVLSLAGAEAWRLSRSPLVLAGLLAGGLVAWHSLSGATPLWWNAAWQVGYSQAVLAMAVFAAAQLATGRPRRDGMQALYDSYPVSVTARTCAQLAALAGTLPASLLLTGGAVAVITARGAIGTPDAVVLAGGPLLVILAGAAGIAVGRRFPHPVAGILGAIVLFALCFQSYHLPGAVLWLFPWTTPDQLGWLPAPLTGYPPGGAHVVELAGIGVVAAAGALASTAGRTWHRSVLVVTAVTAVVAVGVSGAVQLRPIPTDTLNRLVSSAADPASVQHCTTAGQVRYCVYPGFDTQLPALRAPVSGVLARLPIRPAGELTVAQAVTLALDDPPLTHGHTAGQVARWTAQLRTAPASNAPASAIESTVGQPAADFALAMDTAEWALNMPRTNGSHDPGNACVPLDQAREAIAIWLATTATHTSAGDLLAGQNLNGGPGTSVVLAQTTPVIAWNYPAEYGNSVPSTGPQTTAAGYLLAQAMTRLPVAKVTGVLRAAWPTWLDWHTTDAQLAAALGIPMPTVATPHFPPAAELDAPRNPVCTS